MVIVIYWAFTSLSTVGFGDFAPISDTERVVGAFILLLGVAIFSYIMGNFIDIINQIGQWNEELEDDDRLNKFYGVIAKYNGNEPMDVQLKERINKHFTYKWNNDRNQAFQDDTGQNLMSQMPEDF